MIYFCEVEVEFVKSYKQTSSHIPSDNCLTPGKVFKFNLFNNNNSQKIIKHLKLKPDICFIIDVDCIEKDNFSNNIKKISKYTNKINILVQSNNFEEEICYNLNKSKYYVLKQFSATSLNEFKNIF